MTPSIERLANAATAVLAGCAIVVTVAMVHREFFNRRPVASNLIQEQSDWRDYAVGHSLGPANAPVTIVEFADFECPYCRRFTQYVDSLRTLGTPIRVVYRHFPLKAHRFALLAARASECAATENRFEAMHDALFAYPDSMGLAPWSWFATKAGMDSTEFLDCFHNSGPLISVGRDTVAGRKLGISGTPLLLVGRVRMNGLPPFDTLRDYVDRAAQTESGTRRH